MSPDDLQAADLSAAADETADELSYLHWREALLAWPFAGASAGTPGVLALVRRVGSTNGLARRIARAYGEDHCQSPASWVIAYEQRRGRGRGKRSWVSPPGAGVWATRILRAPRREAVSLLPLLVPTALASALDPLLDRPCRVKWPNDLMVQGRKLGGVLIESLATEDGETTVLIGFGINHSPAGAPVVEGTTMDQHRSATDPALALTDLTWTVVRALDQALEREWPEPRADRILAAYRQVSVHQPGDSLRCRIGDETLHGSFDGFDDVGRLCLTTAEGPRKLAAGEIVEALDPAAEESSP